MIVLVTGDLTNDLPVIAHFYGIPVVETPALAPGGFAQMTFPGHEEPLGLNRMANIFLRKTPFAIGNMLANEMGCGRLLVLGGRHVGRYQAMRAFATALDAKIITHPLPKPESQWSR